MESTLFDGPQSLSGESPLAAEQETSYRSEAERLISCLPAKQSPEPAKEGPTNAAMVLPRLEGEAYRQAAAALHADLGDFLLAGFASLLSRLTRQDVISIARLSTQPQVRTYNVDEGCSFEAMLNGAQTAEIRRQAASDAGGISFRYLPEAAQPPSPNTSTLGLSVQDEPAGLRAEITSASGRWDAHVLEIWLRYLRTLWNAAAKAPQQPVRCLPLLDETSTLATYTAINRTVADFPNECVQELFARQAALTPDATAVISGGRRVSYKTLDEQSTRLASILVGMGAAPGQPVAICMERSADMPMALLAVLKSGSYYVPLDPQNPRRRLMAILEECRPVAILSSTLAASTLQADKIPVLCVDQPWPKAASEKIPPGGDPERLAYVIYTSGTTGQPKGVMIAHRSLTNELWSMRREPGFSAADRLLAVAAISFDMAVSDMFLPLISGGLLVVAGRGVASDPDRLAELLEQHDITFLEATPVTWRMLVNSGWCGKRNLKMLSAGESLARELANQLLCLGGELWNGYGLTETTIYSSYLRVEVGDGMVRLGPPIANTSFYVMDDAGHPLPEGVPGELYIGGVGVGCGYLKRPELTVERFVDDPFRTGEKLCRTGDLVRIVNGREIEFFGRLDHQIKLRGYRIELGEIESVLRTHPSVKDAVTVLLQNKAGEDGLSEPRLLSYVTLREGGDGVAEKDLREHAALSLPGYMLPQRIVALEKMPLSPSGKIDRRSLPDPGKPASSAVEPENELEAKLLRIFREVLAEPSIGVTGNFFEFGGYSLVVVKLFARIKHVLGLDLPVSLVFDAPTSRALARLIDEGISPPIVVPIRPKGRSAPLFVVHSYLIYDAMSRVVEDNRPLYGLRTDNRGQADLPERIDLYAKSIAEVCPEGPINLVGWCAAASLTIEIGRRLMSEGRQISLLALIDADRPGYLQQLARRVPLSTRLLTGWRFHKQHFRKVAPGEKLSYLGGVLRGRWNRLEEDLSSWHRAGILWLERHCPIQLPANLLNNAVESLEFPVNYPWQPYPGRIVLYRASYAPELPGADETWGWSEIAAGGVEVVFVPGNHESMFRDPHLEIFGQRLRESLAEGDAVMHGEKASAYGS